MREKKQKEKERLEKEINGTLSNMNNNMNNNSNNINENVSQDINMESNKNEENKNAKNEDNNEHGNGSVGSCSVSVSDPEDMNTPVANGVEERPQPAPNILPKLTFLIKPRTQLKELTREMLHNTSDINKKKQLIGERLYHLVNDCGEMQASKITGHILSFDVDVLFNLLSNKQALADNILLAKKRINEINQKQQQIRDEMTKMKHNVNDEIGNMNSQSNREKNESPNVGSPQL